MQDGAICLRVRAGEKVNHVQSTSHRCRPSMMLVDVCHNNSSCSCSSSSACMQVGLLASMHKAVHACTANLLFEQISCSSLVV
jgi:hypothetical protein